MASRLSSLAMQKREDIAQTIPCLPIIQMILHLLLGFQQFFLLLDEKRHSTGQKRFPLFSGCRHSRTMDPSTRRYTFSFALNRKVQRPHIPSLEPSGQFLRPEMGSIRISSVPNRSRSRSLLASRTYVITREDFLRDTIYQLSRIGTIRNVIIS